MCDSIRILKRGCDKNEVAEWKKGLDEDRIKFLSLIDINALNQSCSEDILKDFELHLIPIIENAKHATAKAKPEITEILKDKKTTDLINELLDSKDIQIFVNTIGNLVSFINRLQRDFREEIRVQSTSAISAISDDIARMWAILHPDEKIENVHLYLPAETDKAIEIGLEFYGKEQPSPRLTLSEGHRNSLGLCIFLSMAKRNSKNSTPIFLDDVVVSFDRDHRGMVSELLEREFNDRQVILFTHDREWFIELKQLLNASFWEFHALMPWIDPGVGIRWSEKDTTYDDSRSLLELDPAAAGNAARKIMDIHFALIAEKLEIKLPYLHRERNDHRIAHDFLNQIIINSPKCFQIKKVDTYQTFDDATEKLKEADKLLIAWGNRASHSFDTVKAEAQKLINTCEIALGVFTCPSCRKVVTKNNDTGAKQRQCECGGLRWRYGKS